MQGLEDEDVELQLALMKSFENETRALKQLKSDLDNFREQHSREVNHLKNCTRLYVQPWFLEVVRNSYIEPCKGCELEKKKICPHWYPGDLFLFWKMRLVCSKWRDEIIEWILRSEIILTFQDSYFLKEHYFNMSYISSLSSSKKWYNFLTYCNSEYNIKINVPIDPTFSIIRLKSITKSTGGYIRPLSKHERKKINETCLSFIPVADNIKYNLRKNYTDVGLLNRDIEYLCLLKSEKPDVIIKLWSKYYERFRGELVFTLKKNFHSVLLMHV